MTVSARCALFQVVEREDCARLLGDCRRNELIDRTVFAICEIAKVLMKGAWAEQRSERALRHVIAGWLLTVRRPGLLGCLNCRWLPSVTTKAPPSALDEANDITRDRLPTGARLPARP